MSVTEPLPSSQDSSLDLEDDEETVAPPSSPDGSHECPAGWSAFQDYCYFQPGAGRQVCDLLGANYLFNYCVTREYPG